MQITREFIHNEIQNVQRQRIAAETQVARQTAIIHGCDGALQMFKAMLAKLDAPDAPAPEAEATKPGLPKATRRSRQNGQTANA
jgi:hypothetical protein